VDDRAAHPKNLIIRNVAACQKGRPRKRGGRAHMGTSGNKLSRKADRTTLKKEGGTPRNIHRKRRHFDKIGHDGCDETPRAPQDPHLLPGVKKTFASSRLHRREKI